MKVQDIMTKSPKVCTPGTHLTDAANLLWSAGCGALPVVDEKGELVSIVTDRDICVALGTRNLSCTGPEHNHIGPETPAVPDSARGAHPPPAVGLKSAKGAADLTVADIMCRHPAACRASDDIHTALYIMRTRKIRRLPVVGEHDKLEGILCMSEIVLNARHDDGSATRPELSYEDVMRTLICVYRHNPSATGHAAGQDTGKLALML